MINIKESVGNMSNVSKGKEAEYRELQRKSSHGLLAQEDEEDNDVLNQFDNNNHDEDIDLSPIPKFPFTEISVKSVSYFFWDMLTFAWMKPLLTLGNTRALEQNDLYCLPLSDTAVRIYARFRQKWQVELSKSAPCQVDDNKELSNGPSLTKAFINAFGWPFLAAGFLKLIHDSCLFIGPMLLNSLINLLSDPTRSTYDGYFYVLGLFLSNFLMSLCLRQYFWWCFRVGMNLRSAVITSVYHKSMVISAASLYKKSSGEITNLMSVDATRLQELTPYLHAVWYSFYQIVIAMYLLWGQMGPSCVAGFVVIVGTIPLTGKITKYMKTLQKAMSSVRDERIKISNEVLSGMKVIKLQAWEDEYRKRIDEIRTRELKTFRSYVISQALSGALYTTIPLMVGICTFTAYIASGHTLDVATALTSLALFEILRFPLFMLPNVMNNIVEARVSVDRVQSFLLEPEKEAVPSWPLIEPGVMMKRASLVWERSRAKRTNGPVAATGAVTSYADAWNRILAGIRVGWDIFKDWKESVQARFAGMPHPRLRNARGHRLSTLDVVSNPLQAELVAAGHKPFGFTHSQIANMTSEQYATALVHAQLWEAESKIEELEKELRISRGLEPASPFPDDLRKSPLSSDDTNIDEPGDAKLTPTATSSKTVTSNGSGTFERLLALSRINFQASPGKLIAIVGQVGSGKSSILGAVLGDMKLCFGTVSRRGRVAYVGQRPFIQNSTLKDNITFGNEFNEERYQRTLQQSALLPDLEVLPGGDMTEIGERGINLSGGQKARVALARALYDDADVYLLDDPLAAVDAHVGQHLFQQSILPLQKSNKCILLVTNALQYVKFCSKILVVKQGRIYEEGTYDELLRNNSSFAEMMIAFQDTKDDVLLHSGSAPPTTPHESKSNSDSDGVAANTATSSKVSEELSPMSNSGGNSEAKLAVEVIESSRKRTSSESHGRKQTEKAPANNKAQAGALIVTEEREVGDVSMEVYKSWAQAAGGVSAGIGMIILYFSGEAISVTASWWLSYWSAHRDYASPWYFLGIYIAINVGVVFFMLGRDLYGRLIALKAAKILFNDLLGAVLFAPMAFFDTTPLGRIVNRFSKDIYTIDEQIPQTSRGYLSTMCKVFGVLLYICIITPMFVILLVPICLFYRASQRYYIKTSRELTRLDSTSRSPIFALFSETLDGLSTIRAFESEKRFLARNAALLDANQQAYFLNFSANCWLAVRLELAGTCIVTSAALLAVVAKGYNGVGSEGVGNTVEADGAASEQQARVAAFAGLAGLAISMALSVTQSLNWSVRMASDLESQMVSVERVQSYASMPQEAAHHTARDPPPFWPSQGGIEMRDVQMRYRPGLPLVLRGVTLSIQPHEKIGVVGRTGAGKSSLLTVFLRLVELEGGCVTLDGVDLSTIGLNALRSRIAVIPQDPVLFSGTVRSNLDPFKKFTDLELWESLRRTTLAASISSLEDIIAENGSNFSVGQRQLLCISRALLSKSKIIIMDEATAAVDVETDSAIQKSIREEFAYATCLTVAHRLNTIMDSDKVLVMDQGIVAEFDTPANLLSPTRPTPSMFAALVAHWDDEDSH